MPARAEILVIAATPRELATSAGWRTLLCGVGPVEAAASTAAAIEASRPAAILHVGIAGGRRRAAFPPASLVIGREARYDDLVIPEPWSPDTVQASRELLGAVQRAFPGVPTCVIGTSGRVGGSADCDVEAMEGFAVLRAAERAGVPAIEVRAIANEIEEEDRARWHFAAAFAAISAATPQLVAAIESAS
ncbi:MAG: hypothetical protein IT359_10415 [Gemmatimonadaceae bacterium]|nr:hypothetical protein [Gemmatimonadaceae bacterium]